MHSDNSDRGDKLSSCLEDLQVYIDILSLRRLWR